MEKPEDGLKTSIIDGEFLILITQETDFSPDGGYSFYDYTAGSSLTKDEAEQLAKELEEFIRN